MLSRIEILLQSAWYKREPLSFLVLTLLWPLSQIYRFLAYTHRKLYQFGVLKVHKVSVPVVVIGNIVAGGGGKTPTVIALAQHLQAQGIQVGVISRGYGRSSTECLEVKKDSKVSDVGDEPASMLIAFSAPIFVANSRFEAATALLKAYPAIQVIISDDGLQHHALQHDIAITVFDDRGLGNGLLLPAGPLRESSVKTHNSLILHTGNQASKLANVVAPQFTASRALASYALQADGNRVSLSDLKNSDKLLALAGIANPEAFFEMLRAKGLNLSRVEALPDHFDFESGFYFDPMYEDEEDPRHAKYLAYNDYQVICTLKDAVKIWPLGLYAYHHALAFPLNFEPEPAFFSAFDTMLKPFLNTQSST